MEDYHHYDVDSTVSDHKHTCKDYEVF